ncbi:uncharacterized protein LOC128959350 [Oppia nitens]|uniref:uncharacterized protein LOC128959350 n=1 Tax=Oppia nitens TaxID=1686743 RepID=UPI0023DC46A3|nr:uncharacterized protein LOC128959350 [Oppia nitens]
MTATTGDDDNTNANADNTECGADATDSHQQPMDVDNNNSVGGDGSSGSTAAADGQHQPTASDTGLLSTGEAMKNMFRNLYEAVSLAKIKQYIQFINARVLTNKTYFFYINDFYHYVCVLTDQPADDCCRPAVDANVIGYRYKYIKLF